MADRGYSTIALSLKPKEEEKTLINTTRCLYNSSFTSFQNKTDLGVFGELCESYHGDVGTNQRDAWTEEISIMKTVLTSLMENFSQADTPTDGQIIFEYDIPRLGKRVDVVLLYKGIIFCIEFKVGESRILEPDVDQVLDYALDLNNFHKFSQERVIVPILVATNYKANSTIIQRSGYNDNVINPLVTGKSGIYTLIDKAIAA